MATNGNDVVGQILQNMNDFVDIGKNSSLSETAGKSSRPKSSSTMPQSKLSADGSSDKSSTSEKSGQGPRSNHDQDVNNKADSSVKVVKPKGKSSKVIETKDTRPSRSRSSDNYKPASANVAHSNKKPSARVESDKHDTRSKKTDNLSDKSAKVREKEAGGVTQPQNDTGSDMKQVKDQLSSLTDMMTNIMPTVVMLKEAYEQAQHDDDTMDDQDEIDLEEYAGSDGEILDDPSDEAEPEGEWVRLC